MNANNSNRPHCNICYNTVPRQRYKKEVVNNKELFFCLDGEKDGRSCYQQWRGTELVKREMLLVLSSTRNICETGICEEEIIASNFLKLRQLAIVMIRKLVIFAEKISNRIKKKINAVITLLRINSKEIYT